MSCYVCFESMYKNEYIQCLKRLSKEEKIKYNFNIRLNTIDDYIQDMKDIDKNTIICHRFNDSDIYKNYYKSLRFIPNKKIIKADMFFPKFTINHIYDRSLFSDVKIIERQISRRFLVYTI